MKGRQYKTTPPSHEVFPHEQHVRTYSCMGMASVCLVNSATAEVVCVGYSMVDGSATYLRFPISKNAPAVRRLMGGRKLKGRCVYTETGELSWYVVVNGIYIGMDDCGDLDDKLNHPTVVLTDVQLTMADVASTLCLHVPERRAEFPHEGVGRVFHGHSSTMPMPWELTT